MIIEVKRMIKEGKLEALSWSDRDKLYIKDSVDQDARVALVDDSLIKHTLFMKDYCEQRNLKAINTILMEYNDINEFFKSVKDELKSDRRNPNKFKAT